MKNNMSSPFGDHTAGPNEGPWLSALTDHQIRIKTHGRHTNNQLAVFEYIEKPHSIPPVFTRHEFVEVFCIIEGILTFQFLDEPAFDAPTGTVITAESWNPHTFWNTRDEPVRVLVACSPAGLEQFFEASHDLLQRMPSDISDPDKLAAEMKRLRDKCGLEHVAPAPEV